MSSGLPECVGRLCGGIRGAVRRACREEALCAVVLPSQGHARHGERRVCLEPSGAVTTIHWGGVWVEVNMSRRPKAELVFAVGGRSLLGQGLERLLREATQAVLFNGIPKAVPQASPA